jgi:hypothetical protein
VPLERPQTYPPGAVAPVAPGAPPSAPSGTSTDIRSFRLPTATDASRTADPPQIQGVPPVITGPQLGPTPAPRPEGSDRMTSQPVSHPSYFQLLTSPPKTVPAQTVGLPSASANLPADDGGWVHVNP